MIAVDLGVRRVDQALRLVRALGAHRYVAGRLHLVHAFAIASVGDDAAGALVEARAWALATLEQGRGGLDLASRDERLWRRCSDTEVATVLDAYWAPGPRSRSARDALHALLERHGLAAAGHQAFDESVEDLIHPLAVDAGWELLGLAELDPERHKGVIAAFGDRLEFESAAFEEGSAIPSPSPLYELPAVGPAELLAGADGDGVLAQPFVVWAQGNETYLEYVFRGVSRAARLEAPE